MMRELIAQQLDYIFFLYGLSFIFLAVVTFALHRIDKDRLPWHWLVFFGLTHGLNEWLNMLALSLGDPPLFLASRLFVLAVSFLCLLEFFRRGLNKLQGLSLSPYATFFLAAFSLWGLFHGLNGLFVSFRYTLGFVGTLGTAYIIRLYCRKYYPHNVPLSFAVYSLALYGFFTGLIVPKTDFYPPVLLNQDMLLQLTMGLPVQLFRGTLAVIVSISIWTFYLSRRKESSQFYLYQEKYYGKIIAVMLIFTVITGWMLTDYNGRQKEGILQESLLRRVQVAAAALEPSAVRSLKWKDSDLASPDYHSLKEKLARLQKAAPDSRFVCLMGYQDHRTYVLADSEPPESPDYSPPGQYYQEASEEYIRLLGSGKQGIIGPLDDRWGSWITGVSPLMKVGGRIIYLVFDFDAVFWRQEVRQSRLIAIVITVMLSLLILTFFVMYQHSMDIREALAISENTLRHVFDHVHDAIIVHDGNGRIIDANDRTLSLYGLSQDEIGRLSSIHDLFSPLNSPDSLYAIWTKVLEGKNILLEWDAHRPRDGVTFPVEIYLCRMDLSGEPVIVATIRDLTASKQAEEQRRTLQEQFLQAQKMESIGRLAGGVAHDFNNLLAIILGYAEMALEFMTPPGAPHRESLLEIQKAGERAKSLIRQLLAFSSSQVLDFKSVHLNRVVQDFEKLLQRLIGEDIRIDTRLSPALPRIQGDVSQLEQILLNLSVNARDSMPSGGVLTFVTDKVFLSEEYAKIHPDAKPGEYALLSVTDTGEGMSEEVRTRIFEPFFTTKEKGKGTGLGLSTVYGIVAQHRGYIDVTSAVGKGTTFQIYFPASVAQEADAQPSLVRKEEAPRQSLLVLVVEDDPAIRRLSCRFLDELGHRVLEAHDVGDAIRLCTEHRSAIDVMLTDVIMPEMSGHELFARVHELSPAMKVIYMSGYPDQIMAHNGFSKNGACFLQKPFSLSQVSRILQDLFGKS